MQLKLEARRVKDAKADVLFVAATKDWAADLSTLLSPGSFPRVRSELEFQRFRANDGDVAVYQTHGSEPWRYIVVAGVGDGSDLRSWYGLAHLALTRSRELRSVHSAVWVPETLLTPRVVEILAEGIELSAYRFGRFKSAQRTTTDPTISLLCSQLNSDHRHAAVFGHVTASATGLARDLINTPSSVATPVYLAASARKLARSQGLTLRLLDEHGIKKAGMGAILGVAQGSALPPRFIELVYRPRRAAKIRVALVGKGITFDSGGLSLKPAESMQSQKRDMAGGATVLGAMSALRGLGIRAEVRAYIPCAENMPSGTAMRPGDVLTAYNGKTIEVLNTDAEGRLVLADALAYAAERKPDVMIDLATLTAAVRIALGSRYAGILGNDPECVAAVIAAGKECGENLWELPLVQEYRGDIESSVADLKNIGEGGTGAGTIIGALFLREFVGDTKWCHVDFSSTVMAEKPLPCHPRGASGFGVRTLLRYLRNLG